MAEIGANWTPDGGMWALGGNWECPAPWQYVLSGDVLEPRSVRIAMSGSPQAAQIEQGGRLYQRLIAAVHQLPDGEVSLVPDWERKALEFANLYAPPVAQSSISPVDRIPVARHGNEALLIWWTITLNEAIAHGRTFRALEAAVQVRELLPALRAIEVAPGVSRGAEWCMTNTPGWLTPGSEPAWCGTSARCLSREQARQQASAIATAPGMADQGRYYFASNIACGVFGLRMAGVRLSAVPDRHGDAFGPALSVYSLSPLSRIWFGLWEDTFGIGFRRCEKCRRWFLAKRHDSRFCGTRCRNAFGAQTYRSKLRK